VDRAAAAAPAITLGPIIHNPQMVEMLRRQGVESIDRLEDIPFGSKVVIRSHGVGESEIAALNARGCEIIDATCPFVRRIHEMVKQASDGGIPVIVVGESAHPEVVGILGWTNPAGYTVMNAEDVEKLPEMEHAIIVSQTTMVEEKFDELCGRIRKKVRMPDIRKTICPATHDRQAECEEIARKANLMIVIGGRESSNSYKLYRLAQKHCPNTCFIETAQELGRMQISASDTIGITAGASTPDCIIKEVVARMNDIEKKVLTEDTQEQAVMSMEDVEATLVQIRPGQIITGTVVQITEDEVCVNVGYKADGLVKKSDLSSTDVKIGDEIEVEVVKVNDGEGNVLLSQKNIIDRKAWEEIVAKQEAGEFVEGIGKEAVKGGLLADVKGVRTFIPASQLSLRYVEKIDEFVGQTMTLKIIESDKAKKRIVASRKAVLIVEEAEKKKELWAASKLAQLLRASFVAWQISAHSLTSAA